jgi:hypothetical protein
MPSCRGSSTRRFDGLAPPAGVGREWFEKPKVRKGRVTPGIVGNRSRSLFRLLVKVTASVRFSRSGPKVTRLCCGCSEPPDVDPARLEGLSGKVAVQCRITHQWTGRARPTLSGLRLHSGRAKPPIFATRVGRGCRARPRSRSATASVRCVRTWWPPGSLPGGFLRQRGRRRASVPKPSGSCSGPGGRLVMLAGRWWGSCRSTGAIAWPAEPTDGGSSSSPTAPWPASHPPRPRVVHRTPVARVA